jgi:ATP synthase protein I
MSKIILPNVRRKAYLSVIISGIALLIMSIIGLIAFSRIIGISILLGGLVWLVPQGYFAVKLFHQIETTPKKFITRFYINEIVKLFFVSILFICYVKFVPANWVGLFAGYFCAQMFFCFSMFYILIF